VSGSGEGTIVLQTPRLRLRKLTEADQDATVAILSDPEVTRMFAMRLGPDDALAWIRRQRERYAVQGYGYWMVEDADGACVGQAGLVPLTFDRGEEPALGWVIAAKHRGRGYATEAAAGVVRRAFDATPVRRVLTLIRPLNLPSKRVAAKLGMRRAGCMLLAGLDHVVYRLPRADRAGAERWLHPGIERRRGGRCCS
jgi:RimJ/RimL family protein N-acetyltransferase